MGSFLFWFFLVGIVVASLQDIRRREIDNWLNILLLFGGCVFIAFRAIFENNSALIFQLGFVLVLMYALAYLFNEGRVFSGGDAKLLFAMTPIFIGLNFLSALVSVGIFIVFLMIAASVYGIIYSLVLYFMNFEKVNREIKKRFSKSWCWGAMLFGLVVILLGFLNVLFLSFGIIIFLFPILYVFAKGLEKVVMIYSFPVGTLREGELLALHVRVGKKVIKADWDGLSLSDISFLKKSKLKSVKLMGGLPFAPAFLIAFLLNYFFRDVLAGFLAGLI